ncbi:MAG: hypothetical protein JO138_06495, partial [Acidobacteriaceae bacterium]|nr:hypothetical protein [Acidobacteriaceae bacterium]
MFRQRFRFGSFPFCAALLVCTPARAQMLTQQGSKLVGSGAVGPAPAEGASVAVSADGSTALIGGVGDNNAIGAAWVFTRDGNGNWNQQGSKLVGSGAMGIATQGTVALSADGNTAVLGGLSDNSNTGAVWVFTRDGNGNWSQQGSKLVGSGAVGAAYQGTSVALAGDGNTALVGGPRDNSNNSTNGFGIGAAWVFTRDSSGNWSQQGSKLVGSGAIGAAAQGVSVALSGDANTALVGGAGDNNALGAVWVFTRDSNGNWSQQGSKLVGSGTGGQAEEGESVALSADGNTALLGGPLDNNNAGAVWVFTRDSNGNWSQQGSKLVGSGGVGAPYQGSSVALSGDGNTAVEGGPFDDSHIGAVWVFTRDSNGNWSQQGSKLVGSGAVNGQSGAWQGSSVALSLDGNTALEGGPFDNNNSGAAWVFVRAPSISEPLQFVPVTPCRVVDTRNLDGPFGGPELVAGTPRTFNIPASACNIPSSAAAYSLNVTVVPDAQLGYLTVWPSGQSQPVVSTLNSDGRIKANAAIVPAGSGGGIDVYATDPTQLILDIDGYFVPAGSSTLAFYPVTPCRVSDTRN